MFSHKCGLLMLLSLLREGMATNLLQGPITGDVAKYMSLAPGNPAVTAVHADVVAPSGSTAVIDFALSTPVPSPGSSANLPTISSPCSAGSCPVTLIPSTFHPDIGTWIQHLETTFSVPPGSTPVIHFRPTQRGEAGPTASTSSSQEPSGVQTSSPETPKAGAGATASSEALVGSTTSPSFPHITPQGVNTATLTGSPQPPSTSSPPRDPPATSDSNESSQWVNPNGPSDGPSNAAISGSQAPVEPSGPAPTPNSRNDSEQSNPIKPSGGPQSSNGPKNSSGLQSSSNPHTSSQSEPSRGPQSSNSNRPGQGIHTSSEPQPSNIAQTSNRPKPSGGPQSSNGAKPSNGPQSSKSLPPSDKPQSSKSPASSTASQPQSSTSSPESPATTPPPKTSQSQQSSVSTSVSVSLGDSPDDEQMSSMLTTLAGSSSAEVAAMLSHRPTDTATVAWDDLDSQMSQVPTSTTTGAAVATEGIVIAGWLTKVNSNIQAADLKDRDTWDHVKGNLDDIEGRIDNYVRNRNHEDDSGSRSSKGSVSGCTSGGGLAGIFKAVSCFVKAAEDKIKGGSKDIGPLIDEGLRLTKSGFTQLKDKLPHPEDITNEEEEEFKRNFKILTEGTESLEDLEKEEEKEKETSSSSSSTASSTSSSETTTCTSPTTVEDCMSSTLFITSTDTGQSGTPSPTVITSTTSECSTQTGCDVTATTETTTSYTQITGSCEPRTAKFPPGYTKPPKFIITGTWDIPASTVTSGSTTVTIGSGSRTTPGTTFSTRAKVSSPASTTATTITAAPCEVVSVRIPSGYETLCACSQTTRGNTVTSTITAPPGGKCGAYTAFPTAGFIDTPPATAYDGMCENVGGRDGKPGYCRCHTSAASGYSSQWVPIPHTQGSETVFDCRQITSVSFTPTPTPTTTATPVLLTDYTSTDIGNGNIYAFPTASITTNTHNYGRLDDFTPFPQTVGVGTATFEEVDDYRSTDGLTTYYYAEATGDGNGEVTAVGTPTATAVPEATQNCVRYVIPGPDTDHTLNSAKNEFIYAFWGIAGWNNTDLDEKIPDLLASCEVTEQIDVQQDTGRWGTVAMWNNGRHSDLDRCIIEGLEFLGSASLGEDGNCEWIYEYDGKTFWYEDSAPAEIDWVYDNFPKKISPPYPLSP